MAPAKRPVWDPPRGLTPDSPVAEGPAERSLVERDRARVWHPFTQMGLERDPVPVASASGAVLTLEDGREIIDAVSSWWTSLHGHGEPALVEAMANQARTLDHVMFAGTTHRWAVELAERLCELAPGPLTRAFYSDNGSTAVEVALKMALQAHQRRGHPERRVFVALEGSYHGDTFGAMSVGDPDPFFMPFKSFLFDVERIPAKAEALEETLERLGERAAGVILEPLVQGAAGMWMHGADFVRAARRATSERGLYLVADEVMTGFGRTGELFACARAGVEPDLLCLAKGLTGGVTPMSVTLATEELFELFYSNERAHAFFHGHSFTAHPIGCAVALASLDLVIERDVPGVLDSIGAEIEHALRDRLAPDKASNLRRTGGIVAFDLADPSADGYLADRTLVLRKLAVDSGVLLRPLGSVVYAMPPACLTQEQLQRVVDAMVMLSES